MGNSITDYTIKKGGYMISNRADLVSLYGFVQEETNEEVVVMLSTPKKLLSIPKSVLEDWPDPRCNGEILLDKWWAKVNGVLGRAVSEEKEINFLDIPITRKRRSVS